jgi:hypothetical protein
MPSTAANIPVPNFTGIPGLLHTIFGIVENTGSSIILVHFEPDRRGD